MPKVIAKMDCFVDNCLRRQGDVFEYSGPITDVLERVGAQAVDHSDVTEPESAPVERPRRGRPPKARTVDM